MLVLYEKKWHIHTHIYLNIVVLMNSLEQSKPLFNYVIKIPSVNNDFQKIFHRANNVYTKLLMRKLTNFINMRNVQTNI